MRLYHAVTIYQLLSCISYCEQFETKGDDILVLAHWMESRIKNEECLKAYFKKVIYYDGTIYNRKRSSLSADIVDFTEEFLKWHRLDLNEFEEIIVGGVQYVLGIYLAIKRVPFVMLEESCGIISNYKKVFDIDWKLNPERTALVQELGLYSGEAECVTKIMCDLDAQKEGFACEKCCDFKLVKILSSLDRNNLSNVLSIFGTTLDKIDCGNHDVLLLTQQFFNLRILDFDDAILLYKLYVDFYLSNKKILIKTHPDDSIYYEQFLDNVSVLREMFPSELLPFVLKNRPKTLATVSSTGVNSIHYLFSELLKLDFDFEQNFRNVFKYYLCLLVAKQGGYKEITLYNANLPAIKAMKNTDEFSKFECRVVTISDDKLCDTKNSLIVIDECSHDSKQINIEGISKNNDVLILNCKKDFGFYRPSNKEVLENCLPIVLKKTKINENGELLGNLDDEVCYFISKNEERLLKMKDLKGSKTLKNTGVKVSLAEMSEEELEIERLKGVLSATEKRLNYYVQKEKEEERK